MKNEEYYKQKVLLFVQWDNERTVFKDGETWKELYERHKLADVNMSELNVNCTSTVPGNDDDAEEEEVNENDVCDNEDWMIVSRLNAAANVQGVELGRREVDLNYDWHYNGKYEQYGDLKYLQSFIDLEKKKECDPSQPNELGNITFSDEQQSVIALIEKQMQALRSGNIKNVPQRVVVQGKAGTGKSLLISYMVNRLQKEFGADSYLLLAPTGVAAVNIGGATVHSTLKIPISRKSFQDLQGIAARNLWDVMTNVKFVILDEYSMVGLSLLGMIDKRLREGTGVNEPFGGLCVYFFGDYKQLPPVQDAAVYSSICFNDLAHHCRIVFNSFQSYFVLQKCFRQKDLKFKEILDRLSIGASTTDDYDVLKSRFQTFMSRSEIESFNDAIRLYSTVESVDDYNEFKLHSLKDGNGNLMPIARIPAQHHGKGASPASADKANGLTSVLYLAIGTRIMLRSNLWVKKGLVNGSMGTVVDILYADGKEPPEDAPTVIMCKFDQYTGPGIGPENLVPITSLVRSWSAQNGSQCTRQQFPLVVCYACSIHKSQEITLDKAVIDIERSEFALGLTYVGLSRVKSLEGLLLKPFPFKRLKQISGRKEMSSRKELELRFSRDCD